MKQSQRVHVIDCHYLRPQFAAAYLVVEGSGAGAEASFIDNNTSNAVPRLLRELAQAGLHPEQVRHLVVTHVHLDHAAGTAELLAHCPNAKVIAHPRAVRHLVDPSRLVASAKDVYGEETFDRLYGTMGAVDPGRLQAVEDEERLPFGASALRFLHTRGHANHHVCIVDETSGCLFSGDSFGLRYPHLQNQGVFVLPSTSPTDFDADAAISTVRRIRDLGPPIVYPTHFGGVREVKEAAAQLEYHLEFAGNLLERSVKEGLEEAELFSEWLAHLERTLERDRRNFDAGQRALLELDLRLNAQGIAFVSQKLRLSGQPAPK